MPKHPKSIKVRKIKVKRVEGERKTSYERGYNNRWRKARKQFLLLNPLCVHCLEKNRVTPATDVDHIKPHKGDMKLFWEQANWQALCKSCHSRKTVTEDGGFGNQIK